MNWSYFVILNGGDAMFRLVKKDLKLSLKINIFAVIYSLFISVMGMNLPNYPLGNIMYILGIIMLVFISVIYSNGYDDKNKTEVVLNSFPIKRTDIVKGKYMTLIIFMLISCVLAYSFTNIIKIIGYNVDGNVVSILDIIAAITILFIFYSVYYPLYFKLGDLKVFNTILWMLMFASPSIITKIVKKLEAKGLLDKIASFDLKEISLYTLIFSIAIYYISFQISKKLYMKREF